MRGNYRWSEEDELMALYLSRFGDGELPISAQELANQIGMGWSSMERKIANFRQLDGHEGADRPSRQAEIVFERCKALTEAELESMGRAAIQAAMDRYAQHAADVLARRSPESHSG